MTMAILAVLGYKALKHFTGSQPGASPSAPPAPAPGRTVNAGLPGGAGGGFGDLLKGGLGGLLAGGAAGSVLSGGLGDLLKQFQQSGHGDTANSWVNPGPNKQIAPRDLADALGADQINTLTSQTGLSRGRIARRIKSASAGGRRPSDARRTRADRERAVATTLIDLLPAARSAT